MWTWGDGFDCYAAGTDAIVGYWDASSSGNMSFVAGRFSGSQAITTSSSSATTAVLQKASGSNDGIHHISLAYMQTTAVSGSTLYHWFTLMDGSTAQCSIVFRSDGAILLVAGASNGATLATYTGAVTASNTWYQFEIEIRVSNTAGYMNVRKLGNTSNDFASATNLDTAATANDYANVLKFGNTGSTAPATDDLLWRSDSVANGVAWVGDIRCFTRRPASDAAVQWSRSGTVLPVPPPQTTTTTVPAGVASFLPFTAPATGTIGLVTIAQTLGTSAAQKCAIYANAAGVPTTVLGTATENTSSTIGTLSLVFPTPVSVTAGTSYFVALELNGGPTLTSTVSTTVGLRATIAYASFPVANPSGLAVNSVYAPTVWITPAAPANWAYVSEQQQDAASSYVYSSNVGDSDLYGISAISSTPASIVAVTTRAYLQKSDAGTRNTSVRLLSGGVNADSASAALNTSWAWQYRTDTTDPATGRAWTAVGVNNAQVGVIVTA